MILNTENQWYTKTRYAIHFWAFGSPVVVYADNMQDALDSAVDVALENGWTGIKITDPDDLKEAEKYESVCYAGNFGTPISNVELHIQEVSREKVKEWIAHYGDRVVAIH